MSAAATLRHRAPIVVDASLSDSERSSRASTPSSTISDLPNPLDADLPTFVPPNFTMKDLLGAIPAHCFERSALRSSSYVVADFTMLAIAGYCASYIDPNLGWNGPVLSGAAGFAAKWAAWAVYWVFTGFVGTGIWILAHECGHQAFSTSKAFNNAMGLVLHSFVLVPYHSWRISHAKHHAATGHMTRDEVFIPKTLAYYGGKKEDGKVMKHNGHDIHELLEDAPLYRFYWLCVQQLVGWPAYLLNNASGQPNLPEWVNHYDPNALIFDARHRKDVLISDAALGVMLSILTAAGLNFGWGAVVKYYIISYLIVNHDLVMITYLQHTDPTVPHYRKGEWNFQRGATSTIDRNMLGPVGPYLMHGICETHVAHHVSSKIPHYHAWEATEKLKEFLGPYYNYCDENMYVTLWKQYRSCRYVDEDGDVCFYRDAYGRAQRRVDYASLVSDSGVDVADIED